VSIKNGVLLRLAASDFDVLITADQDIEFSRTSIPYRSRF